MSVANASQKLRTVADPTPTYESTYDLWIKSRAVCRGERFVKALDARIDVIRFSNLLIPFSPSMSQTQYDFYRAEAEFPGIVAQYAKTLVGGLLRKQPQLVLPESCPKEAYDWIMNQFGQDGSPLVTTLDAALWEEMQTSRTWIMVDYPFISDEKKTNMVQEDFKKIRPYPVMLNAESIVNWKMGTDTETGAQKLLQLIVRKYEAKYGGTGSEYEFHPQYVDTVWVHEINESNVYQIRKYEEAASETKEIPVVNGHVQQKYAGQPAVKFEFKETISVEVNGKSLDFIPAWPLNGSYEPVEPILTPLVDKEIALYNKISRRNHLMYGAATYTPYVMSDMEDKDFQKIVNAGLGSWFKIGSTDKADVLATPTDALEDMEATIAAGFEEMAKMGIRMLSPESAQSGVALDIRNAAQTAQLGTLNTKISNQMRAVIVFMINWRFDLELKIEDVQFQLSADFNPTPLGADWLRLATEWYQQGLIPRSIWLVILKQNDIMPPDYDDKKGQTEINSDDMIVTKRDDMNFAAKLKMMDKGAMTTPQNQPNK